MAIVDPDCNNYSFNFIAYEDTTCMSTQNIIAPLGQLYTCSPVATIQTYNINPISVILLLLSDC